MNTITTTGEIEINTDIINRIRHQCRKDIDFIQKKLNIVNRKNYKSVSQVSNIYKCTNIDPDLSILRLIAEAKKEIVNDTQLSLFLPKSGELDLAVVKKSYLQVYAKQLKRTLSEKIESYNDSRFTCTLTQSDNYSCYY